MISENDPERDTFLSWEERENSQRLIKSTKAKADYNPLSRRELLLRAFTEAGLLVFAAAEAMRDGREVKNFANSIGEGLSTPRQGLDLLKIGKKPDAIYPNKLTIDLTSEGLEFHGPSPFSFPDYVVLNDAAIYQNFPFTVQNPVFAHIEVNAKRVSAIKFLIQDSDRDVPLYISGLKLGELQPIEIKDDKVYMKSKEFTDDLGVISQYDSTVPALVPTIPEG